MVLSLGALKKKNEKLVRVGYAQRTFKLLFKINANVLKFYETIFDFAFKMWQRVCCFQTFSVCLIQRRGPRDDIANLLTLKNYLAL